MRPAHVTVITEHYRGQTVLTFKTDGKYVLDGKTGDIFRFARPEFEELTSVREVQIAVTRISRAIEHRPKETIQWEH